GADRRRDRCGHRSQDRPRAGEAAGAEMDLDRQRRARGAPEADRGSPAPLRAVSARALNGPAKRALLTGRPPATIGPTMEDRMDIVPLGPGFAAELRGVTLRDVAEDDAAYAAVRAAFEEHSVLVFRGQDATDTGQLDFSRRFGPPEITKVGSASAGTYFAVLTTIGEDGKVVPADHRLAMRNKANQLWHTDSSFKRVPALTSVLSARIIPARGGETEYVSTRLAWERLEGLLRKRLANSFAWHDYAHSRGQIAPDLASTEERAALPPQCWRMAWTNP